MAEKKLTERQRRFADFYLASGNARQAAIQAGLSPRYGSALCGHPAVLDYVAARGRPLERTRVASAQEILEYLTDVLRGDSDEEPRRSGQSTSRMKAAELLGKRLGLFTEGVESAVEPPVILDDIPAPPGDG